jgi:hypothetical protein
VSIVQDDDGLPALQLLFTADDAAYGGTALTSVDANGSYAQGVDFSNGSYFQATMRLDANSLYNNPWGTWVGGLTTWSNSYQLGLSNALFEFGIIELYADGGDGNQYDDSAVKGYIPGSSQFMALDGWGTYYPIDRTQWFTVGMQVMQNAGDLRGCMYAAQGYSVSQSDFVRCDSLSGHGYQMLHDELNARNYLILQAGHPEEVDTPMILRVRDVQVWTCWPTASGPDAFGVSGRTCENL